MINQKGSDMHITIPEDGYWFDKNQISLIEQKYQATYMGYWCTKKPSHDWNESPVDVFYVENPDRTKGHTNYFGMFKREGVVYITDASSAFNASIRGVLCEDGEVLVSRYRHDYVVKDSHMVDGGRDYMRCSSNSPQAAVFVVNGKYVCVETDDDTAPMAPLTVSV